MIIQGIYYRSYILTCVNCGKYIQEKIMIEDVPYGVNQQRAVEKYIRTIELRLYTKYKIVNKL